VAYSGTHDNDTTLGWYLALDDVGRHRVRVALSIDDSQMPEALLRALLASAAPLAVIPMQDLLSLGSDARLNVPGTASGNWTWRMPASALRPDLAAHWRALNLAAARVA
jgi:4-alpha-glucanotransferase